MGPFRQGGGNPGNGSALDDEPVWSHVPVLIPRVYRHWLELWAASKRPNLHFEVLNAGRESVTSADIEGDRVGCEQQQ